MSALEMCLAIVEALAAAREADDDLQAPDYVTQHGNGLHFKATKDRHRAIQALRSLPIPTPEQLAELRERVK
jgi:hypothetical protein